jgi:hypothetical protein
MCRIATSHSSDSLSYDVRYGWTVSIHAGQRFSAHVDRVGGVALTVLVFGWRSAHWWQRICSAASIPLCLLCAVLLLNMWVGHVRTVEAAWHFATVGAPPNQADLATVKAMAANGTVPRKGRIVPVTVGSAAVRFQTPR